MTRRWLRVVVPVMFVVLAGLTIAGALSVGVSSDEKIHQDRMNSWFDHGWYLWSENLEDGEPHPAVSDGRVHAYGAAFSLYGHAVAVLSGAEVPGETNDSGAAFSSRGIAVATLGIAAALAVGYATWVVTRSRLVGAWTATAVMAMPLWAGYSMFAVKDIPVAAGWTMVTAGLVVGLHGTTRRRAWAVGVLVAVGTWFSFGVRPALVLPLLGMGVLFYVLVRSRLAHGLPVLLGFTASFAAVAAVHYRNSATPVEWLSSAVGGSSDFSWYGTTLTAGELMSERPPWWYLPAWIGGSVPILLGLLALAGAVIAVRQALRDRTPQAGAPSLWTVQAAALPLAAILFGSVMYAGLRHHLYVLPAIAALAGLGAWWLLKSRYRTIGPAILILALVIPTAEHASLFPYTYVYKNALAGDISDRWETDLHWISAREAATRLPPDVAFACIRTIQPDILGNLIDPRPFDLCDNPQATAYTDMTGRTGPIDHLIARAYRGTPALEGCTDAGNVTRWFRGERVLISYVLHCPSGGVD